MANTVEIAGHIDLSGRTHDFDYQAIELHCNYDTVDSDLTLMAAKSGYHVSVLGLEINTSASFSPVFKSNATEIIDYAFSQNGGRVEPLKPLNPALIFSTKKGESLNFRSNSPVGRFVVFAAYRRG